VIEIEAIAIVVLPRYTFRNFTPSGIREAVMNGFAGRNRSFYSTR
jgi:hypothetical protein